MPLFSIALGRNAKKWIFQNLTQVVALILDTSATPLPLNFAEFGAPALNRVIYAPHDHNTGRVYYSRPFSLTMFMLSIAINRAEHVCAAVISKHNYMLMCNHKIVINIMLCLLNSTGHTCIMSRSILYVNG